MAKLSKVELTKLGTGPTSIVKKNKWAKIVKFKNNPVGLQFVVYASGPRGWITQSDYTNRTKADDIYKRLSQ